MYDYDTNNFLRNEIEQARRYRREQEIKLAGYQTNVARCETQIALTDARLADLERLLDFHTLRNQDELAHAFANAVLDRDAEAAQETWIEQGERAVDEALDALDSEPYGVGFEPRAE